MRAAATVAIATLALAGCGGSSSPSGSGAGAAPSSGSSSAPSTAGSSAPSSGTSAGGDLKIGVAYDVGGRGDQSFNDAAAAGVDKFKSETGATVQEAAAVNGESDAAREERLTQLAEGGYDPILVVGFVYATALSKVAPQYPDTHFAIVDSTDAKGANIANLTFAEDQGSFLVGVAAALKSKTHNVGFVGGVDTPLINKFERGFKAGVEAGKSGTKVQVKYLTQPPDFSGFGDPAKGKTAAKGMYDAGADVVFQAAGGSGAGVFQAAAAAKAMAIGVDSDQAKTAAASVKSVIITSMLKKVDVASYDFIKSVADGSPLTGEKVYDLKAGGVDYATTGGQVDDIKSTLDDYKQKLISGAITIPSK
uniref:BMP family lipoprotein n=1 Tax=Motilibacter peucedani TaxID=598650 RepID=UPI001E4B0498|nr:BMP family ABC transporter substrate-binding protein [Motilibacter peucedani]